MVYNDFFKDTVSEGNVIGKETESETRTSGYLNDNKNVESKGASSKAVVCLDPSKGGKDTGVSSSGMKWLLILSQSLNPMGLRLS